MPKLIAKKRFLVPGLRTALLAGCLAASVWSSAAEEQVTLNFVNADIAGVVKAISQITGKNFLIDPRVKGTVNIVSAKPVSRSSAYSLLLAALRMQGFAALESDGTVKIVPEPEAKTLASPVVTQRAPRGDQMVTKVFALRYGSAAPLVPVLRPLIPPNNTINADPDTNTLVITDYASNIERLTRIIDVLDAANDEEPRIVPVRYASAIDLADTLGRVYTQPGGGAGADVRRRVTVLPDSRTNSLLVHSDSPARLARMLSMIYSLDQPTSAAGNIHVIYLKNADAARLAQTLRSIASGEAAPAQPAARPLSPITTQPTTTTGATPTTRPTTITAPTASVTPTSTGTPGAGGFIQADTANNALIITAPDAVYNNLRRVVEQLDTRPAQIHVEALIAEVNFDRASEWGIQWQDFSGARRSGAQVIGGTNFGSNGTNILGLVESIAKAQTTGTLGIPPGLNIGIIAGRANSGTPNLGVLARALETDARANILSTPNLLTLDNQEATILVGQNVPIVTGSYAQTGAAVTATPFQTFERRDVGVTLKIRPQVTEGGLVRLQIAQETSSLQPNTISNPSGPITNKRAIESSVLVDDGDILVLGGLIEDNYGLGEDKVPLLGDLPLIGGLFRYETRTRTKTNMMVFIKPTIVRDATGSQGVTASRYDYIIGEQRRMGKDAKLLTNEAAPPVLPPLQQVTPPDATPGGASTPLSR